MAVPTDDVGGLMTADDVRTLAEIGTMVLSRGLDGPAEVLFRGVSAARPGSEAGAIGSALVLLHRGRPDAAVDILKASPRTEALDLFLGMALMRTGDKDGARAVLSDLLAASPDGPSADSARQMLAAL